MSRQIQTVYYNRDNRSMYTSNAMSTVTTTGPQFFQNNTSYTLNCYIYANTTSTYDMSGLTGTWECAIGNYQDPVVVSNNASINIDSPDLDVGLATVRINCTSAELTEEVGTDDYKNFNLELRANPTSDIQTVMLIGCTVRNTVIQ